MSKRKWEDDIKIFFKIYCIESIYNMYKDKLQNCTFN